MDKLRIRISSPGNPTFKLIMDDLAQRLGASCEQWNNYESQPEADIFYGSSLATIKIRSDPDAQFRIMYLKPLPRSVHHIEFFRFEDPNSYDPEKIAERIKKFVFEFHG